MNSIIAMIGCNVCLYYYTNILVCSCCILLSYQSLSRPVLSTLSVAKSTTTTSAAAAAAAVPATKRTRLVKPDMISPIESPHDAHDICSDDVIIEDETELLAPLTKRFQTPQKQNNENKQNIVTPSPIRTKRDLATARDQLQAYETIIGQKEMKMRTVSSSLEERLERVTRELEEEKVRYIVCVSVSICAQMSIHTYCLAHDANCVI